MQYRAASKNLNIKQAKDIPSIVAALVCKRFTLRMELLPRLKPTSGRNLKFRTLDSGDNGRLRHQSSAPTMCYYSISLPSVSWS